MEPIGGVRPMAGLLNRIRRFTGAEPPTTSSSPDPPRPPILTPER
ncbi:MAG TPA: hypothetical protein VFV32_08785 [Acidimicrobiales bacterium]|nr:hypothetical protein [Acidimicrobiales bacterium]